MVKCCCAQKNWSALHRLNAHKQQSIGMFCSILTGYRSVRWRWPRPHLIPCASHILFRTTRSGSPCQAGMHTHTACIGDGKREITMSKASNSNGSYMPITVSDEIELNGQSGAHTNQEANCELQMNETKAKQEQKKKNMGI